MAALPALLCAFVGVASASQPPLLVMGDWGGTSSFPYYTGAEKHTAAAMATVAESLGSKLAVALGDNFYDNGVPNADSPRFKQTFEDVFNGKALQAGSGFRFQLVGGNHDHMQNITAQTAYTTISASKPSSVPRWVFPSEYYTFTEGDIQFVLIDTVILSGNNQLENGTELVGSALPGPADQVAADAQWTWLESTLASSKAPYLVVGGHYPVYSICEHGPTSLLIDKLKPLLIQNNVTLYMNGHDHCAEYIDVGDGVQYHTIGSAHVNDPSTAHAGTLQSGQLKFHKGEGKYGSETGGFASMAITDQGLVVTHRDGDGSELFSAPAIPARKL